MFALKINKQIAGTCVDLDFRAGAETSPNIYNERQNNRHMESIYPKCIDWSMYAGPSKQNFFPLAGSKLTPQTV